MTPSSISRVSPQAGALSESFSNSQQLSCLDEDGVISIVASGRTLCAHAAAHAWVSEAVPPPAPDASDDFAAPATAIRYYRQRRDSDSDSAVLIWLSALLCMPRLGSGRLRAPSRLDSADSVDFVSTWQRAQAEASVRKVIPALKQGNDAGSPPVGTPDGPSRTQTPPIRTSGSCHGSMTEGRSESPDDCSTSLRGAKQCATSCQLSADFVSPGDPACGLPQGVPEGPSQIRPDSRVRGKRSVRFN